MRCPNGRKAKASFNKWEKLRTQIFFERRQKMNELIAFLNDLAYDQNDNAEIKCGGDKVIVNKKDVEKLLDR